MDDQNDTDEFNNWLAEYRKDLDINKIPVKLRYLKNLAEIWAIGDDGLRGLALDKTPIHELQNLVDMVLNNDAEFDDWLAGDEAKGPHYSDEYLAFTHLILAADGAKIRLKLK